MVLRGQQVNVCTNRVQVNPILEDDVFLMMYKELYFRHLYDKVGQSLTLEQRMESFDNYCMLFDR